MATFQVRITIEGKTRQEVEAWALDRLLSELNAVGLGEDSYVAVADLDEEALDAKGDAFDRDRDS